MTARNALVTLTIAAGCLALWMRLPPQGKGAAAPAPAPEPAPAIEAADRWKIAGTGSCSARGCHGAPERAEPLPGLPVSLDEYPRWLLHDKHALAYDVLYNDLSKRIAHNLGIAKAHEEARCLACHTNPAAALPSAAPLLQRERVFGVGCEACHGPAAAWLAEHTTPAWRTKKPEEKEKAGMFPVDKLPHRAKVCAGCHIGAASGDGLPARDMNHDLIAAGHPRLDFEFAAFTANMPPHWSVKTKVRGPLHGADVWLTGQVASAQAALELLAYRADSARGSLDFEKPWPEFSEYNCFACHHDLRGDSWRQQRGYGKGEPGALPWSDWHLALPEALANQQGKESIRSALANLRAEMGKKRPDQDKIGKQAKGLAKDLNYWHAAGTLEKVAPADLLTRLVEHEQQAPVPSWDRAAQLYLALDALHPALTKPDPQVAEALKTLYSKLAFPPQFDSPRLHAQVKSPFHLDYKAELKSLLKQLQKR